MRLASKFCVCAFILSVLLFSTCAGAGDPPAFPLRVSENHRYLVDSSGSLLAP